MTSIESQIVEVTVFPDRARVTRRGKATLEAGVQKVEFPNLPMSIDPDSVRAAGRGTQAALLGVDTRMTYFTETPAAAVAELEKQLEALGDKDKTLADQNAAADVQASFMKKLATEAAEQLARGIALGRANVEQAAATITFTQQRLTEAQTSMRSIEQQRRELSRQVAKLTNELNSYRSAQPRQRYAVTVEVDVKQAGELTLELIYMTGSSGWVALYDIRATGTETDAAAIALGYLAQVTQSSGEDWTETAMTLSTARPALASIEPELGPWYLEPYAPPVMRAKRVMPPMAMAAPAPMQAAAGAGMATDAVRYVEAEAETPEASVNAEGSSVTFKLAQTVTIPSDGTPHKVSVSTVDLKPRLDYISVPKLAEVAYRRAKVSNQSEYLFLPGEANLFVEGDFVGSLNLKRVAPSEEFDLSLGVDDRVFVKRELKARTVDKTFIGDRRRLRVGYEVELRNLRAAKADVEVHDQFPVGRHEQIKVKLESADPKPSEQSELNELTWKLTLGPNEKRFLRFDFTIEYPVSMTIEGLP
jgi:uncharacterized protein (TIGR02231 family)